MTNAEIYTSWIKAHGLKSVDLPRSSGLFRKGELLCALPYIRAYWSSEAGLPPSWEEETWLPLAKGFTRFLRADQALEWINASTPIASVDESKNGFYKELRRALLAWLVPVEDSLAHKINILERRIEAVRVRANGKRLFWSRRSEWFPDAMRSNVFGLDAVHTPENDRAGLTRYLCDGWQINDVGQLAEPDGSSLWGPSTSCIEYRLHDAPRRLMLAASLQSRAVDLSEGDVLTEALLKETWNPPGRNLQVSFSTLNGLTHEDAIVISASASEKLRRKDTYDLIVNIPAVASRVEVLVGSGSVVRQGETIARAFIDLYALGWRRHEAQSRGAEDGWIEVGLPGAVAADSGKIIKVSRRAARTLRWREQITITLEKHERVKMGDKLSTRHGIKGVVSGILDDQKMPNAGGATSDIILSPVGVARRGAMGQFKEASIDPSAPTPPGEIFVMRQPQDAHVGWSATGARRSFVRGVEKDFARGQRYGEMEFWALMGHAVANTARELLSSSRSTARWMQCEAEIESGEGRVLATRALNRYLAMIGARIEEGSLLKGTHLRSFEIPCRTFPQLKKAWDMLDDPEVFKGQGGLGAINLGERLTLAIEGKLLGVEKVYILPPWLRPPNRAGRHELTKAYRELLFNTFMGKALEPSLRRCLHIVLETSYDHSASVDHPSSPRSSYIPMGQGMMRFLRREVLGRRLTRSARAVIVPRPDIRIDEIAIPSSIADIIFEGLSESQRSLVLVNRNPTLHRRGLLALRPLIEDSSAPVFGMPLGVLQVLGADFDGDQATVVALENDQSLLEARLMMPGSAVLRIDRFRLNQPAFPLLHELSSPVDEFHLAADGPSSQPDWSRAHHELLNRMIASDPDGWNTAERALKEKKNVGLWEGLDEPGWMLLAEKDMSHVFNTVRKKGHLGGILRHEIYRRAYTDPARFYSSVEALQAVTERLVQTALSVKTGAAVATFDAGAFFAEPSSKTARDSLLLLDEKLNPDDLGLVLGDSSEPAGLLRWLSHPTCRTLFESIEDCTKLKATTPEHGDPRLTWFL